MMLLGSITLLNICLTISLTRGNFFNECIKYYANILTPFSPLVVKKIREVLSFNLLIDVICTNHGVIWQKKPEKIVEDHLK